VQENGGMTKETVPGMKTLGIEAMPGFETLTRTRLLLSLSLRS
jgi:hypothetical protein